MAWQELLAAGSSGHFVAPWIGGRRLCWGGREWRLSGRQPREYGWYRFAYKGRIIELEGSAERDPDFGSKSILAVRGYLAGDRFIPEHARVEPDPNKLIEQTQPIYLVEPGLDRFVLVIGGLDGDRRLIYDQQVFDTGPEPAVRDAFIERKADLSGIYGVTPALDLAFRFATWRREVVEKRRAEERARREEEERQEQLRKNMGTGEGRRAMAAVDFDAAAKAALAVGGAEFMAARPGVMRNEMIVQYRYGARRLECTCDKHSLRIIDSGVCLDDHRGTKGDTWFTLESLPTVIGEAIKLRKLVVYRHGEGDRLAQDQDDDWED